MFPIDCIAPKYIVVRPKGSLLKKDGKLGSMVYFVKDPDIQLPPEDGELPKVFQIPCGKCLNCRKNQARAWAIRIQMEMQYYKSSEVCFLTLTYDDDHVPEQLEHKHVQVFLHSLRCRLDRDYCATLRYFLCGEYGSKRNTQRPHFHLILFGFDFFKDSKLIGYSKSGLPLFTNRLFSDYWHNGYAEFGYASGGSAMYTAQYQQKKLILSENYGEKKPPYIQMSRRPGIGSRFIEEHKRQIMRDGGCYLNGNFIPIDRYCLRYLFSHGIMSEKEKEFLAQIYEERSIDAAKAWSRSHDGDKADFLLWTAQKDLENLRASALVKGGV